MRMKEVAKRLGVSVSTLKKFLVIYRPYLLKRTPGGYYRFTEDDVRMIDHAMTQEGIRRNPAIRLFQGRRLKEW